MSTLLQATYSLDKLYLFPVYQTREHFANLTGQEAPPFDSTRPPKYWFDPDAEKSLFRNVVYQTTLAYTEAGGLLLTEDGRPQLQSMLLLKKEAATVNIPPNMTNYPGADVPSVPVPLRELAPEEELVLGFGGVITVRNKKFAESQTEGFTVEDRELLRAIARKLDVVE